MGLRADSKGAFVAVAEAAEDGDRRRWAVVWLGMASSAPRKKQPPCGLTRWCLLVSVISAAFLHPGFVVLAGASTETSCLAGPPLPMAMRLAQSDLIVLGTVTASSPSAARIAPTAYLKGPAQAGEVEVRRPERESECPPAVLRPGARVVALLQLSAGVVMWPDATQVYDLTAGQAVSGPPSNDAKPESELLQEIRTITNQYAVPAVNKDEGAGLSWLKTVVPVSVALLIVFGIGLVLMRSWHRIDPS